MPTKAKLPPIIVAKDVAEELERIASGAINAHSAAADVLLDELNRARVVPEGAVPADVATIGSRIRYLDEAAKVERSITLSWPDEADISTGKVSVLTPIGVALLGLKAGASFGWSTRDGRERTLSVLEVSAPEASDPA